MRPRRRIAALVLLGCACVFVLPAGAAPSTEPGISGENLIGRIEFRGLHRVAPAALRPHLASREGEPLDPRRVAEDVRRLDRLGWFDEVRVEVEPMPALLASTEPAVVASHLLRLVFHLVERPFLAGVEFTGTDRLDGVRAEEILAAAGIRLKLASPADRAVLHRAARALRQALAEMAYPEAEVRVRLEPVPTDAVVARFEIRTGPKLEVARVRFPGAEAPGEGRLRRQMEHVAPHALLAGPRGKKIYTAARLAEDLERVETFLANHGYADAELAEPEVRKTERRRWRWLPLPNLRTEPALEVTVAVHTGPQYRVSEVAFEGLRRPKGREAREVLGAVRPGATYSVERVLEARRRLAARQQLAAGETPAADVVVVPEFDAAAAEVKLVFSAVDAAPYTVRRIEFTGHRRFSDRYYRGRIGLAEGEPFDPVRLEQGLERLAAAGTIRPVRAEDIDIRIDEERRTADLVVRVEEIGRQRASLVGGTAGLGSTIGLAYQVFDLFGGEELLRVHLEGGPQSLQTAVGLAKESLLGTRTSLGIQFYRSVLRPLAASARGEPAVAGGDGGRLFTQTTTGMSLEAGYPLTRRDRIALGYTHAAHRSRIPVEFSGQGLPAEITSRSNARTLALGWERQGRGERWTANMALSGGALGGDEHRLAGALEYARLEADPLSRGRNTWAVRGHLSGVGALSEHHLPIYARLWPGEELVRGFRTGELGAYALERREAADGSVSWTARPAGSSVLAVVNTEYRMPLRAGADAAAFFDLGTGWLVPRWLGTSPPTTLAGTGGVLRASAGLELRVPLPFVGQPLRVFYAANPLRLAESFLLPDGTLFRPRQRRAVLGWGLGSLF